VQHGLGRLDPLDDEVVDARPEPAQVFGNVRAH
jgi:hypothetical protein